MTIDEKYPHIADWATSSCIQIGHCDNGYTNVTARVMDEGGTIWESEETFSTLEALLNALEKGLAAWCDE